MRPEDRHERRLLEPRDVGDSVDAAVVQLRGGLDADSPQPLDRQRVEEGELTIGLHDEQAVGLGDPARDLREELGARDADRDRQPDALEDLLPQPDRDLASVCPETRRRPPTSRNASSIEMPSTSGVVSLNTSNTALLASEYAEKRGETTTRFGHSCRAWRPPIGVWTPNAFAS